jgi:hypothetical protein
MSFLHQQEGFAELFRRFQDMHIKDLKHVSLDNTTDSEDKPSASKRKQAPK